MSELINRWYSRVGRVPGMVACGLRYPDGGVFSRSWDANLTDTLSNELWNRLAPMAAFATRETPERLQWTFERALVIGAARASGPTFFVLLSKKGEAPDVAGVERMLNEFRALRG